MPKQHKPKLGSGKRFATIEAKAKKSGARDPAAVAASAGIQAHGVERMEQLSRAARKRRKK